MRKLIAANAISRFGDSIDMIAFSWLTYTITHSASWSAVTVGVNQLISVLFQPFIGSVVETMNKKKVMVCADFLRFLTIFLFYIIHKVGVVNPAVLVCFTAIISFIETFRIPAGVTVIPSLLKEEDFDKGVSMNNSISKCFELLGLLSAASIITLLGADGAVMLDGATFLISAVLISTITYDARECTNRDKSSNYFQMTCDGAKFLCKHKALLLMCTICGLINSGVIPFDSLQSAYINLYFEERVQVLTAISIAVSVGMLLGSVMYQFLPPRMINASILGIGGILLGAFYITAFFVTTLATVLQMKVCIIVAISFVLGIALAFMNNYVQIYFIKEVNKEFLSRISSISTTITTALSPITAFAVSLLAAVFETSTIFIIWGIIVIFVFISMSCCLKRKSFDPNYQE